jgi:hypothetical protein
MASVERVTFVLSERKGKIALDVVGGLPVVLVAIFYHSLSVINFLEKMWIFQNRLLLQFRERYDLPPQKSRSITCTFLPEVAPTVKTSTFPLVIILSDESKSFQY